MVYCCVCGLAVDGIYYPETFDLDEEEIAQLYDREKLPESQLEWTQAAFCTINERSFEDGELYMPIGIFCFTTLAGEYVEGRNCSPKFQSDGQLPDIASPDSFFPVHLSCLTLIEQFVKCKTFIKSEKPTSGITAIQYFYKVLDSLRPLIREDPDGVTGKGIEWKHGYYGARRFWFDSWTMEPGWEFLCADPFEIATFTDFLLSNLNLIPVREAQQELLVLNKHQTANDCSIAALDALPNELLNKIIALLPISSILNLHRTNRKLFNKISLDQNFWRDQLVSGRLISFIWDLDREPCLQKDNEASDNTCWDWRALARDLVEEPFVELALKNRLSESLADGLGRRHLESWRELSKGATTKLKGPPPLGLINRVRILRIIEEAMRLAENQK